MICYSCMKSIKTKGYCLKCQKALYNGIKIKPLDFDKQEFYEIKSRMTNRISLSGVQDKISLTFGNDNDLVPTEKDGKYILKPIPRIHDNAINIEDISANEHLSMQISAQLFKIPTALNGLIEFKDGELAYITKRFDYAMNIKTKELEKIDQEDFASVLEYTTESAGDDYKYSSSYEECAKGIHRTVAASIPAIEDFFKRIVLNYLISNGDAHLKNFSLMRLLGRKDYVLTPNYDILHTRYHLPNEMGLMGLDLFKEYESPTNLAMGRYCLEDFEEFAKEIGISDKRLKKIFKDILSLTPKVNKLIEESFLSENAKTVYKADYKDRLDNCLCYSVKSFSFVGITQDVIDKYL